MASIGSEHAPRSAVARVLLAGSDIGGAIAPRACAVCRRQRLLAGAPAGRRGLSHPRRQRAIAFVSQILLARWMGVFEFGIYIYAWTWVLLIGGMVDLGLGSAAQRFIPEYTEHGKFALLRGFLGGSRWLAPVIATGIAVRRRRRGRHLLSPHHRSRDRHSALSLLRGAADFGLGAGPERHRALLQLGQSRTGAGLHPAPARIAWR